MPKARHASCSVLLLLSSELDDAGPVTGAPRFVMLFCGTQFGWAAQLPHLFPPNEVVLRVPSFHVFGETDTFKPTARHARAAAKLATRV